MILVDSLFEYNNIIFIWWIQFNDYGEEDGDSTIEHWDEDDNSNQINMNENNNEEKRRRSRRSRNANISAHSVNSFGRCRLHS